jgi:hypothetical protein
MDSLAHIGLMRSSESYSYLLLLLAALILQSPEYHIIVELVVVVKT